MCCHSIKVLHITVHVTAYFNVNIFHVTCFLTCNYFKYAS
jgi:hypothetical protein